MPTYQSQKDGQLGYLNSSFGDFGGGGQGAVATKTMVFYSKTMEMFDAILTKQ